MVETPVVCDQVINQLSGIGDCFATYVGGLEMLAFIIFVAFVLIAYQARFSAIMSLGVGFALTVALVGMFNTALFVTLFYVSSLLLGLFIGWAIINFFTSRV